MFYCKQAYKIECSKEVFGNNVRQDGTWKFLKGSGTQLGTLPRRIANRGSQTLRFTVFQKYGSVQQVTTSSGMSQHLPASDCVYQHRSDAADPKVFF